MMERDCIEELGRITPVSRRRKRAIARELRTHVDESRRELELAGLAHEEAAAEAQRRLGDVDEIAMEFGKTYRPSRRTRFVLALGLAAGMVLGVYGIGGSLANANSTHRPQPHRVIVARNPAAAAVSHHCEQASH